MLLSSRNLGLITTVAACCVAAVTSAAAPVDRPSALATSAASARSAVEVGAQARVRPSRRVAPQPAPPRASRPKCQEDLGYGRTSGFGCGG